MKTAFDALRPIMLSTLCPTCGQRLSSLVIGTSQDEKTAFVRVSCNLPACHMRLEFPIATE